MFLLKASFIFLLFVQIVFSSTGRYRRDEVKEYETNRLNMQLKKLAMYPSCGTHILPNGKLYHINISPDEQLTYDEAKKTCRSKCGMNLLEIYTTDTNDMIVNYIHEYVSNNKLWPPDSGKVPKDRLWFWLGATTDDKGYTWTWESGNTSQFKKWGPEKPDRREKSRNCAAFGVYRYTSSDWHGTWWDDDHYCSLRQSYICA